MMQGFGDCMEGIGEGIFGWSIPEWNFALKGFGPTYRLSVSATPSNTNGFHYMHRTAYGNLCFNHNGEFSSVEFSPLIQNGPAFTLSISKDKEWLLEQKIPLSFKQVSCVLNSFQTKASSLLSAQVAHSINMRNFVITTNALIAPERAATFSAKSENLQIGCSIKRDTAFLKANVIRQVDSMALKLYGQCEVTKFDLSNALVGIRCDSDFVKMVGSYDILNRCFGGAIEFMKEGLKVVAGVTSGDETDMVTGISLEDDNVSLMLKYQMRTMQIGTEWNIGLGDTGNMALGCEFDVRDFKPRGKFSLLLTE